MNNLLYDIRTTFLSTDIGLIIMAAVLILSVIIYLSIYGIPFTKKEGIKNEE